MDRATMLSPSSWEAGAKRTYCRHGWRKGDSHCPDCPADKKNTVLLVVSTAGGVISLRTLTGSDSVG